MTNPNRNCSICDDAIEQHHDIVNLSMEPYEFTDQSLANTLAHRCCADALLKDSMEVWNEQVANYGNNIARSISRR